MFPIDEIHIDHAARMLYARLTRPSTIDVMIYPRFISDIEYRFDQHCGRFIGCFDKRLDGLLCFYLAGRSDPDGDLDHLFVFYFNSSYKTLQESEIEQLKACIPNIGHAECTLKIGIINVKCSSPPVTYLSALVYALDRLIDVALIENFRECQYFEAEDTECPILPQMYPGSCSGEFNNDGKLATLAKKHGKVLMRMRDVDSMSSGGRFPRQPDALLLETQNHLIGAVANKPYNLINFILSHQGQFEEQEHYENIKRIVRQCYPTNPSFFCTRLLSEVYGNIDCNGEYNFYAWQLILTMLPHALTHIQLNELIHIYRLGTVTMARDYARPMQNLRSRSPSIAEASQTASQARASQIVSQAYVSFKAVYHRNELSQTLMDQSRFLIYPFPTFDDKPAMVIADKSVREWIYLEPSNEDYNDQVHFNTTTANYVKSILPELTNYQCRVIIMTSGFHHEYPKVHLLMALYVIARLFPYHVGLPQKVIYGEWELRKYAANICAELQIVNAEFNIENFMVDGNGRLLTGAYQSLPSPLQYQVSVVPKDQCMFCKKRGFKNLGRHMCMSHGGQAERANLERRLGWTD